MKAPRDFISKLGGKGKVDDQKEETTVETSSETASKSTF